MDYLLLCRDTDEVLVECLKNIFKQSNVNKVFIMHANRFNSIRARVMLFKAAKTDYIVTIDSDVHLKDFWIEEMWKYFDETYDVISGRAVSNDDIYEYLSLLNIRDMNRYGYLQCAIVKCSVGNDWDPVDYIKKSDNILFSGYVSDNGFVWKEVPVISMHCDSYEYSAFFQGYIGTILEINSGICSRLGKVISMSRSMIGGMKRLALLSSWTIFKNDVIFRTAGSIAGLCNLR